MRAVSAPASSGPTFGRRLQRAVAESGPIVAGIDPHASLLQDWGLPDTPAGLRTFSLRTLEAVAGQVAAIKPQSAFYERHGSAGVAVLEDLLAQAKLRDDQLHAEAAGKTYAGEADPYRRDDEDDQEPES